MIKNCAGAALLLTLSTSVTFAQEEPWGGNVPGWRFTQASDSSGVNCRAIQGPNLISRRSNGRTYVSVPVPAGLPKGWYREGRASIIIGGNAEPIDAEVTGRLLLHIDDGLYPALIRARGYQWRVSGPKGVMTGSVSFSGDLAKAIAELRACVKANTAAAAPQRQAQASNANSKWSGDWSWVRPLKFNFGGGPAPQPPGPRDVTVRERTNASFELLPNNRVRICIATNPCGVFPFTFGNGAYNVDYNSGYIAVVPSDQGRSLNGQFWFDKNKRALTTPDATFALRQ